MSGRTNSRDRLVRRRVACVVGVVLSVTACGVPDDRSATAVPAEDVPYELLDSTTTTLVAPSSQGGDTSICLTVDSIVLAVGRSRDGLAELGSLLAIVTAGPTEGEIAIGLRSALSGEEPVAAVRRTSSGAEVELGTDFAELPADQQLLAFAQMTCALTAQQGILGVTFQLDDRQIEVPVQGGSLVSRPVTREDYSNLIAN